jgi:hypothetical protein
MIGAFLSNSVAAEHDNAAANWHFAATLRDAFFFSVDRKLFRLEMLCHRLGQIGLVAQCHAIAEATLA